MSQITTRGVRKWITLGMALVLAVSLMTWLFQRQTLPPELHIAAGAKEGLYHSMGSAIEEPLEEFARREVNVDETAGSEANIRLLENRKADLAIVQGGTVGMETLRVVTPLFRELIFVLARKGTDIESVRDLEGKKVWLGSDGSGNRQVALDLLRHFDIEELIADGTDAQSMSELGGDTSIDAMIITAGVQHPGLQQLMENGIFEIVPIPSAGAIELLLPFSQKVDIPEGLFGPHSTIPSAPIPTIATTAFLVSRQDAPPELVEAALKAVHEGSIRQQFPTLIRKQEAPQRTDARMHPTAQRYFNPQDSIESMVRMMESLVATKELLFAIGAGIYLLWIRWRRLKEKELQSLVDRQKEHLDRLLMETLRIERAQMRTSDVDQLNSYLDNVTRIKMQALQELTEEELRGNHAFSIFLDQCSSLIGRMQLKILAQRANEEQV